MIELSPKQIAEFDQAFTASVSNLTSLIVSYTLARVRDAGEDVPEQLSIMSMADALAAEWDEATLVSALAAAVVVLSTAAEGTDQTCEAPCEACAPTDDA